MDSPFFSASSRPQRFRGCIGSKTSAIRKYSANEIRLIPVSPLPQVTTILAPPIHSNSRTTFYSTPISKEHYYHRSILLFHVHATVSSYRTSIINNQPYRTSLSCSCSSSFCSSPLPPPKYARSKSSQRSRSRVATRARLTHHSHPPEEHTESGRVIESLGAEETLIEQSLMLNKKGMSEAPSEHALLLALVRGAHYNDIKMIFEEGEARESFSGREVH